MFIIIFPQSWTGFLERNVFFFSFSFSEKFTLHSILWINKDPKYRMWGEFLWGKHAEETVWMHKLFNILNKEKNWKMSFRRSSLLGDMNWLCSQRYVNDKILSMIYITSFFWDNFFISKMLEQLELRVAFTSWGF